MGFSCSIMAFSPRVPREDIVAHASAGPEATAAALEARFPGRFTLTDVVGDLTEDFQPHGEHVLAGLWGETLVITTAELWDLMDDPAAQDPQHRWILMASSSTDTVFTETPFGGVEAFTDDPETIEQAFAGREPLPFERPYAEGRHRDGLDDESLLFYPPDLANAAVLWMFGFVGETPPSDDVVDAITPADAPLPLFRFADATKAPTPAPEPAKRGGFLSRLLGR